MIKQYTFLIHKDYQIPIAYFNLLGSFGECNCSFLECSHLVHSSSGWKISSNVNIRVRLHFSNTVTKLPHNLAAIRRPIHSLTFALTQLT